MPTFEQRQEIEATYTRALESAEAQGLPSPHLWGCMAVWELGVKHGDPEKGFSMNTVEEYA